MARTKNLTQLVDEVKAIDDKLDAAMQPVKVLTHKRSELLTEISNRFAEEGCESHKTKRASATLVKREVVKATDFNKYAAYVFKHKALDLLPRTIPSVAFFDRIGEGERIPGTAIEVVRSIRITAVKKQEK